MTLELAARCAVGSWFDHEQHFAKTIENPAATRDQLFNAEWNSYWSVTLTVYAQSKDKVLALIWNARPQLRHQRPGRNAYEVVETLSQRAGAINIKRFQDGTIKRRRPTSLVSKFGYACAPTTFAPYDSLACAALTQRGHDVPRQDYVLYMQAFLVERNNVAEMLRGENINPGRLRYRGHTMDQELFELRTTDWLLLLEGRGGSYDPFRCFDPNQFEPPQV